MRVNRPGPSEQALVPVVNESLAPIENAGNLPISGNLAEDIAVAGLLAKSGFFPNCADAAQAFAKMLLGRELGIGQATAMREIYVVQGRLCMSASLMGALIRRSGVYDYQVTKLDNDSAVIDVSKNGQFVGRSEFTARDAEAAGMLGKDNYKKYLRNMLLSRALSNAARWYCPEIFVGAAYIPEEMGINDRVVSAEEIIEAEAYSE